MVATKALPAADCSSRRSVAVSFAAMRVQVVMAMLKTVVGKTKELRCNLDKEEEEEVQEDVQRDSKVVKEYLKVVIIVLQIQVKVLLL